MDFVFARPAKGRSIKNLTVVDDATHEAVAIVPERALSRNQLVRIRERLASTSQGGRSTYRTRKTQSERLLKVFQRAVSG